MNTARILFVEDDISLQKSLTYILEKEGFMVKPTVSAEEALTLHTTFRPDLILLDLTLPGMDGFTFCRQLQSAYPNQACRIIMLTGRGLIDEVVKGLELFADDYITKPFEPRILLARIQAVLRRLSPPQRPLEAYVFGPLFIDRQAHEVLMDGTSLTLTRSEYELLMALAGHPNRVFTRENLLERVRGSSYDITERTIDYQISGLRRKLAALPDLIETVRGVGYKLRPPLQKKT